MPARPGAIRGLPGKRYLAIDGYQTPGTPEFVACIGALYGTAYPLYFTLRRREAGFSPHGPHHEIYLNDPHRVGDEHTKTVLRQGVMPV